jgi:hypothetical protein
MKKGKILAISLLLAACFTFCGFDDSCNQPRSSSGLTKTTVKVPTGPDGLTVEQRNASRRLLEDNKPGSIKHLYIISPYSGQVILYSTVNGKVTSSHKRLTPSTVQGMGFMIDFAGNQQSTTEVLGDDGTYGDSGDYIYWWDVRGTYHQHFLTGGQIVHVSSQPIPIKSVIINVEGKTE